MCSSGKVIPIYEVPKDDRVKDTAETQDSPFQIACSACGLQNPRDSKFCDGYGKTVASICSKCGNSKSS